ncbi:MAG: hypothetical protein ACO2ZG_07080, partial [Flavobacteriaceae bacterium]
PDFHCPFATESNILCFQYTQMEQHLHQQLALRYALINKGDVYLTSCEIQGERYLRVVFMNSRTTLEHCEELLKSIVQTASSL